MANFINLKAKKQDKKHPLLMSWKGVDEERRRKRY